MRLVFGEGNKVSVRLPIKRKKKAVKDFMLKLFLKLLNVLIMLFKKYYKCIWTNGFCEFYFSMNCSN